MWPWLYSATQSYLFLLLDFILFAIVIICYLLLLGSLSFLCIKCQCVIWYTVYE